MFPTERAPLIRSSLAQSLETVLSLNLVVRRDGAGRVLAMESLVATAAVRNMIRDGKTHQLMNVMQTGRAYGMRDGRPLVRNWSKPTSSQPRPRSRAPATARASGTATRNCVSGKCRGPSDGGTTP